MSGDQVDEERDDSAEAEPDGDGVTVQEVDHDGYHSPSGGSAFRALSATGNPISPAAPMKYDGRSPGVATR